MSEAPFMAIQRRFAAHLRDPGTVPAPPGIEARRLQVYRELFYNNIGNFLRNGFPVLCSVLADEDWARLVRGFFRDHACRSPYFVRIPAEFLSWLATGPALTRDYPPFMLELAHYEYMELALEIAEDDVPPPQQDADGDVLAEPPRLSSLLCLLGYRWPVHRISREWQPEAPAEAPVNLLVYRDAADLVGFLELSPLAAALLRHIEAHPRLPGREHVARVAREAGVDPSLALDAGSRALLDWRARGILTGTQGRIT